MEFVVGQTDRVVRAYRWVEKQPSTANVSYNNWYWTNEYMIQWLFSETSLSHSSSPQEERERETDKLLNIDLVKLTSLDQVNCLVIITR